VRSDGTERFVPLMTTFGNVSNGKGDGKGTYLLGLNNCYLTYTPSSQDTNARQVQDLEMCGVSRITRKPGRT
jgi:hypothetical protein